MRHENLESATIVLIGLCAVFWLVFLMFGLVLLEGIIDKKLSWMTAILRASIYGGYTVFFASFMVSCVIGTAACYVRKTKSNRIAELSLENVATTPQSPTNHVIDTNADRI